MDPLSWLVAAETSGVAFVVLGLVGIGTGVAQRVYRDHRVFPLPALRKKLAGWTATPPDEIADLERRIQAYYRSVMVTTTMVIGLVLVLAGVTLLAVMWSGHASAVRTMPGGWVPIVVYPAILVGTGLGYPLAVRVHQRSLPAGPRYADLRRRRLADYRSPRLRWLTPVAIAVQAAAAVTLLAAGGSSIVLLMPLFSAAAYVAAELLMWMTARVPRMVVTPDPATARRCDDMIRADIIARLQGLELISVGLAGVLLEFLGGNVLRTEALPVRLASLGLLLSAAYCMFWAIGLLGLEERLGGTITGWWGRPMPE